MPQEWRYNAVWSAQSVAYSPDGKTLAVGGVTGLQTYSAATLTPIHGFRTNATSVNSLAFSRDGRSLLVGGTKGSVGIVEVWNAYVGALTYRVPTTATFIQSISFSPDGQSVLVSGGKGSLGLVEVWNLPTRSLTLSLRTAATVVSTSHFSPDSNSIAVGGWNGSGGVLEIWKATGSKEATLSTTANQVSSLAFSPDGSLLAVGGSQIFTPGAVAELWSVPLKQLQRTLPVTQQGVTSLTFSPNGTTLADVEVSSGLGYHYTEYFTGYVNTWSVATGALVSSNFWPNDITAITYSPDGATLAFVSNSNLGGELQTLTGNYQRSVQTGISNIYSGAMPAVIQPHGRGIIRGGLSYSGPPDVWQQSNGYWKGILPNLNWEPIYSFACSQDGTTMAIVDAGAYGGSGLLAFYDSQTLTELVEVPLSTTAPDVVAFIPDGTKLAAVIPGSTTQIQFFDPKTGAQLSSLTSTTNYRVNSIAFSPNGKLMAVGGENFVSAGVLSGLVEIWDLTTGTLKATYSTAATNVVTVHFSPNGRTLAVGGLIWPYNNGQKGLLELWNVQSCKRAATLDLASNTTSVSSTAFAKQGSLLYAATDGGLLVFNPLTNQFLGYYRDVVSSVTTSADGRQVACETANNDLIVGPAKAPQSYSIESFAVSSSTIPIGGTVQATVTLTHPAPPGGVPLAVYADNYDSITVPAEVFVPSGSATATFSLGTYYMPSNSNIVTIQSGPYTKSITLNTVSPTPASLGAVVLSANAGVAPNSIGGTVTLAGPAGPQEQDVTVTIVGAGLNSTITLPMYVGFNYNQFNFLCPTVSQPTNIVVTASLNGVSKTTTFVALPAKLIALTVDSQSLKSFGFTSGTVILNGYPLPPGAVITLSSSSPDLTIPATITVGASATKANFSIQANSVTSPKTVTVTATYGQVSVSQTIQLKP